MKFLVSKSLKIFDSSASREIKKIHFQLFPEDFYHLEIGENYIVCNEKFARVKKSEKKNVEVALDIFEIEQISMEDRETYGLHEGNIGYGFFSRETQTSEEDFPASLTIYVFLSADLVSKLFVYNINDNLSNSIILTFANTTYGWEPDGTHYIWKADEDKIYIKNLQLGFMEMDRTERQIEDAEDKFWEGRDIGNREEKNFSVEKNLNQLKYAVYLLAFFVGIHILRSIA